MSFRAKSRNENNKTMKKLLITFCILNSAFCISQNWEWVKLIKPSDMYAGMGIKVGPDGNVYSAGGFRFSIDLGNSQIINGGTDGFVAKFDSAGLCQWKQKIAITSGCGCTNLSNSATLNGFDSQGNLIISGMYCGCGANFGNGITSSAVTNTMYIAKYNPAGQCQWVKTKASTSADFINDVTIDAQDNIYMSIGNMATGVAFCGLNFSNQ